ncbi:MAG: STAS domain-containing protein [Acidimicrobiales bacterium]
MTGDFDVEVRLDGASRLSTVEERRVIVVTGELDLATAPDLRDTIRAELGTSAPEIIIDMEGVEFIDASGIRVLVEAADMARVAGAGLILQTPSRMVRRLIELFDLDELLQVVG